MASGPTLELDRLTAPIPGDKPAGAYLLDTDRNRLQLAKDERRSAVSLERRQRELSMYSEEDLRMMPEEDRKIASPNWRAVLKSCDEIISAHSKDLWVAAWLIEANTRLASFAGLRDGFRLVTELVKIYWDGVSPPPEEDEGYVGTVSQLASLNGEDTQGTLIIPIESLPLLPGKPEFTFAAYREAMKNPAAVPTEAEFFSVARQIDPEQLRSHAEDLDAAIKAFAEMNTELEARCGSSDGVSVAPASSQIHAALAECKRAMRLIARDVIASAADELDADDSVANDNEVTVRSVSAMVVDPAKKQVASREDAFRLLLQVSEFFRKTEPHSPVSFMLQQAVRFGRMELPELLQELIHDQDVLKRFAERTGIELKQDSDDD